MRGPCSTRQPDCNGNCRLTQTGRTIVSLCAALLFAFACSDNSKRQAFTFDGRAMATGFEVTIVDPAPGVSLDALRGNLQDRLEQIENTASTYRDVAEIARFNHDTSTDWVRVSDELCNMVTAAATASRDSGGAFDFAVGALVNLWGFGSDAMRDTPPPDRDIEVALAASGSEKLEIDCDNGLIRKRNPALKIDLSAWAKGYAVDELALLLDAAGQENYLIEIGGEVKVRGTNAEQNTFAIAIESPVYGTGKIPIIIGLRDMSIATSGSYRNFFRYDGANYSHTIDPRSGRPVEHALAAVSVIHESAAYADAMATALLVLGPKNGLALADKLGLAAYFAVSSPAGLRYFSSAAFAAGHYLLSEIAT